LLDAACEVVRSGEALLAVCPAARPPFVASIEGEPRIEKVFAAPGSFVVGDGGALAFSGPCAPPVAGAIVTTGEIACVRGNRGEWSEVSVGLGGVDAGAPDAG